jgi:hypothetical protein
MLGVPVGRVGMLRRPGGTGGYVGCPAGMHGALGVNGCGFFGG